MTENEFIGYWNKEYPEVFPINHELLEAYQDRWFRIHSLPDSKRYADTESDYHIILDRQNSLIDDLIGNGSEIIIVFGLFDNDPTNENYYIIGDLEEFNKVQSIDLQTIRPEEYEESMLLDVYAKKSIWSRNSRNVLLRAIADDEIRAMFVSPSRKCIIAPYDGGVDVIVESTEKRDRLKLKYKKWLSDREDGM